MKNFQELLFAFTLVKTVPQHNNPCQPHRWAPRSAGWSVPTSCSKKCTSVTGKLFVTWSFSLLLNKSCTLHMWWGHTSRTTLQLHGLQSLSSFTSTLLPSLICLTWGGSCSALIWYAPPTDTNHCKSAMFSSVITLLSLFISSFIVWSWTKKQPNTTSLGAWTKDTGIFHFYNFSLLYKKPMSLKCSADCNFSAASISVP